MKSSGVRRIAERYVRALFEVARDEKAIDAVEKDFKALGPVFEGNKDFRHFLAHPLLTREQQAEIMLAVLARLSIHQVTRQFIGLLIAQKRLPILPDAAALFMEWAARSRGEMKAEIVSAAPLSPQAISQVSERLGKAFNRKIQPYTRQDPALLGGIVITIGSQQIDGSLAGKLARLENRLKAA